MANGHQIKLLIKTKDILETLIREEGFEYENILPEPRGHSTLSTMLSMFRRDYGLLKVVKKIKPDLLLGSDSSVAHIGFLTGKKVITFGEDDYSVIKKLAWMMIPFSSCFVSPDSCDAGIFRYKKVSYNGYMKLAYLHPSVFTLDPEKIRQTQSGTPFCLIRMAQLSAHHDKRISGLTVQLVEKVIQVLEAKGFCAFLDSEYELPEILEKYRLEIRKNDIHHLMAFATLIISDSQSMSMEAAMLGTPSIRFNDFAGRIGVLEEIEHRYGMTCGIKSSRTELLFAKLEEWLNNPFLKEEFQEKRQKMLSEKINVLDFMIWFIDKFPESLNILKRNPDYQLNFYKS